MPDDQHGSEPTPKTQLTKPKEGEPIEIPVPKERGIEDLLSRAAKPLGTFLPKA